MSRFFVNEIVQGHKCGTFVILALRKGPPCSAGIDSEEYATLKEIDPVTEKPYRGEITLPVSALRERVADADEPWNSHCE